MHAWQLQDAKSRFGELVDCALSEGPQLVTRRGNNAVVLMAAPECRRLAGEDALVSLLLHAPCGEPLDMARSRKPMAAFGSLIAATALEHGLAVVTRNVSDFASAPVVLANPWDTVPGAQ